MNITFVTTASTDEEAKALLEALGLPLENRGGYLMARKAKIEREKRI